MTYRRPLPRPRPVWSGAEGKTPFLARRLKKRSQRSIHLRTCTARQTCGAGWSGYSADVRSVKRGSKPEEIRLPECTTTQTVRLRVNGQDVERQGEVRPLLTDFSRHELGLTATHLGCEHGACTVMFNGARVRSCLLRAVQADGGEVMTLKDLADGETLHPLQQAFWDHHALQCGF